VAGAQNVVANLADGGVLVITTVLDCKAMEPLLQADLDGELDAATAAQVTQHMAQCERCAQLQQRLLQLRQIMRDNMPYERPDKAFREKLLKRISDAQPAQVQSLAAVAEITSYRKKSITSFVAGAAIAAVVLLMPTGQRFFKAQNPLADRIVAEHVQSLQADHLLDVASTDRHTVKPWFNGKLDFVPPVVDYADSGFPLVGGRLAYIENHNAAALVYRRGAHPINVFIWPGGEAPVLATECLTRSGYNVCSWRRGDMNYWVVSDMSDDEMKAFTALTTH
jgi:anti-sigma factor RsiW